MADTTKNQKTEDKSNQKKTYVLKGIQDIIKEVDTAYQNLVSSANKSKEPSKEAQEAVTNMINPLKGVIESVKNLVNQINISEIEIDSKNITTLNNLLSYVTSNLLSLKDIVNNAVKKGKVIDIRPFVDSINLIVDQINEINLLKLSSKKVEGINNRIDFIKDIIENVSGFQTADMNKQIEDTQNGFTSLYRLLTDLSIQEVPMISQDLVDKVIKNMGAVKQLTDYLIKNPFDYKQIKNDVDSLQSIQSLTKGLVEFANGDMKINLKFLLTKKLTMWYLKSLIGSLGSLLSYINKENFDFDKDFIEDTFLDAVNNVEDIVKGIQEIGKIVTIKNLLLQYKTLSLISWFMRGFIDEVRLMDNKLKDMELLNLRDPLSNIQNIQKFIEALLKIKMDIKTLILCSLRLAETRKLISVYKDNFTIVEEMLGSMGMINITHAVQSVALILELLNNIKDIENIDISQKKFVKNLNNTLEIINKLDEFIIKMNTKSKTMTPLKAEPFINTIKGIKSIVSELKKITNIAERTIKNMRDIVIGIGVVMGALILLIPVMGIFIVSSPIIIAGILAFSGIMKIISLLIVTLGPNTTRSFIQLIAIIGLMVLLVIELTVLEKVSSVFLKNYWVIQLTLLAVVGIIAVIALVGLGMTFVIPFITAFTVGMVAITISVLAILAVVGMLWLLQQIKLDKEKIEENVKEVMSVVMMILKTLTTNPWEYGGNEKPKNTGLWALLGTSTVNMLSSLEGMIAIAAAAISVAGILLIASMLKLIEQFKFDENKIKANISKILAIVGDINTILTGKPAKGQKSDQGFWSVVIEYVVKPLVPLWDALLSMAYLVFAIISVAAIMLIASMLRILQEMNLDKNKIMGNVNAVMDTVKEINDSLNQPFASTEQFDRGILGALLTYISPQIGSLWNAIITMAYLAISIVSIASILLISKMLEKLADLDPDISTKARESAMNVMLAARSVMDAVYDSQWQDQEIKNKAPWWQKALKWIGLEDFIEAIVNLGKIAQMIIVVGSISKLAQQLNDIELKEGGVNRAVNATMAVLNTSTQVVRAVLNTDSIKIDKKKFDDWNNSLDKQKKLFNHIQKLAKVEAELAEQVSIEDIMNGNKLTNLTLSTADDIIKNLSSIDVDPDSLKEKLSLIESMNRTMQGIVTVTDDDVKNTKNLTDTYLRFINRLDQADLQRLSVTEKMMSYWAYVAKAVDNDFDKLVLVLSDKMMPMLDKMNKTMEGVSEVQQSIIEQLLDPTLGTKETTADTGMETGMGTNSSGIIPGAGPTIGTEDTTTSDNLGSNSTQTPTITPPTVVPESSISSSNNISSSRNNDLKGLSRGRKGTEDEPVYAIIVGTK